MSRGHRTGLARIRGGLALWASPKGAMALVLLIILLAFILRLYRLGYQSIWYDEGVSIHLALKDLRGLTLHTAGDIHPPLYYYLLHFWIMAAGNSEFSVAFLSLFFGVLIIPLSYRLAVKLYSHRIGLLTAFLIAISPFNLWYSQEMRMYTLAGFLGLMTLYCLLRLVQADGESSLIPPGVETSSIRFWIGYILSAAAGLYTLYYFAFLLLFENLFVFAWWLANRLHRNKLPLSLARWLLAQGAVLLLYLPWMSIALHQALDPPVPPWRGFIGLGKVVVDSWAALALGQSVNAGSILIWPLLSFLFAIYLLGLRGPPAGGQRRPTAILLCGCTFMPLLMIYLFSLYTPLFHVRYVFTYSPPFYLVLALGFARLQRAWRPALPIGLTILTLACGYSIYDFHFDPLYAADDHRGAVRFIEERVSPGDAVLINAGYAYPGFLYYYEGEIAWRGRLVDYESGREEREGLVLLQTGVIGGDESLGWGDPASDFYATTEKETAQALEQVFAHHPRLWVYRIYDTVTDPQGFIRDWLEGHGRMIAERQFVGESYMQVQCYATAPEPVYEGQTIYHPLDVRLDGQASLLGYEGPQGVRAGDDLPLTLYWQANEDLEADYSVLLHLRAVDGTDFAQLDESLLPPTTQWLVGQVISQTMSLEIPAGTPPTPQPYSLMVEMLDPASGQTLATVPGWRMGTILVDRPAVPSRPPPMPFEPWANFGDMLQLVGYEIEPLEAEAGGGIHLGLLWRAWDVPLPYMLRIFELRDEEGQVQASEEGFFLLPSPLWEREELMRDICEFQIPEHISPGDYELTLTLERIKTSQQREILPYWSEAGNWEETLVLETIPVTVR